MSGLFSRFCVLGLLAALAAAPLHAQGQGSSGSSSGRSSTPRTTPTPQPRRTTPSVDQQRPTYINGRVLMDTGQPIPESVSVELSCGMKPLQVIHTDLGGYFTFNLGTGIQSNMDFSASNEGFNSLGRGSNLPRRFGSSLSGCELRISVPGYHPMNYTLTQHTDMGRIDVGTLRLQRIAGVEGSAISVTSLLVPKDARKDYEKALKEIRKNRPKKAMPHLEKAVKKYDQYAAAWNEIGRIHQGDQQAEAAEAAFQKSIEADPQYIPPHVNLATIRLQGRNYEGALEAAQTALRLDGSITFASFVEAVANFNLDNLDAAEKSARAAEKGAHENIPQLHALLAEIFLRREAYPSAAAEMKTYLEESPEGQFAEKMKENLAQIEKIVGEQASDMGFPAEPAE